jgi:phosphoglycerate kinase
VLFRSIETGTSLVEEDKVDVARALLKAAAEKHIRILLPLDHVIADKVDFAAKKAGEGAVIRETEGAEIPAGFMGVDIGPMTVSRIAPIIRESKTIVWNGPMGIFEIDRFASGTVEVARLVAQATEHGAVSVVGGGDSIAAVKKAGVDKKISHISTGGGASLEFLEGKELPGIAVLPEK